LPSPDGYFDFVTSFETIERLAGQRRFLREIRRVLRPGGVLIANTPDRDKGQGAPPDVLNREEMKHLEEAGAKAIG
jgi:2-polyprenyl-3-methyl-5-hydroxy-6-metoxy-1,4-benzoquinol methylase